jgi:hypothetical protein
MGPRDDGGAGASTSLGPATENGQELRPSRINPCYLIFVYNYKVLGDPRHPAVIISVLFPIIGRVHSPGAAFFPLAFLSADGTRSTGAGFSRCRLPSASIFSANFYSRNPSPHRSNSTFGPRCAVTRLSGLVSRCHNSWNSCLVSIAHGASSIAFAFTTYRNYPIV